MTELEVLLAQATPGLMDWVFADDGRKIQMRVGDVIVGTVSTERGDEWAANEANLFHHLRNRAEAYAALERAARGQHEDGYCRCDGGGQEVVGGEGLGAPVVRQRAGSIDPCCAALAALDSATGEQA